MINKEYYIYIVSLSLAIGNIAWLESELHIIIIFIARLFSKDMTSDIFINISIVHLKPDYPNPVSHFRFSPQDPCRTRKHFCISLSPALVKFKSTSQTKFLTTLTNILPVPPPQKKKKITSPSKTNRELIENARLTETQILEYW